MAKTRLKVLFCFVLCVGGLLSCGGGGVTSSGVGGGFGNKGGNGGNQGGNKGGNHGGGNGGQKRNGSYPKSGPKVIAVWAIEDSFPVAGIIHPGVSAYHENGIERVEFYLDSKRIGEINEESINPDTDDPEFFVTIDTSKLVDGDHDLLAKVVPKTTIKRPASYREMRPLVLRVRNQGPKRRFYLDGNRGSDSNPGTVAKPWKTWNHAESSTTEGDEIIVFSGVYQIVVDKNQNSRKDWKVWRKKPGAKVVGNISRFQVLTPYSAFIGIDFKTNDGNAFRSYGGHHVVFKQCSFYVDPSLEKGVFILGFLDSQGNGMKFFEFSNCKFSGATKVMSFTSTTKVPNKVLSAHRYNIFRGIEADHINDGWMIDARDSLWQDIIGHSNQRITNDHCDFFQFIWGKSSNLIIRDLRLYRSGSSGAGMTFVIQTGDGQVSNSAFLNCAIEVYKKGSHIFYLAPNHSGFGDHVCIVNCTILSVTKDATGLIILSNKLKNSVIGNNILHSLAAYPTKYLEEAPNTLYDFNCIKQNWGNKRGWGQGHSFIASNPGITSPSSGDFALSSSSICIDKGSSVLAPKFDLNHKERKDGKPDLGALER